MVLPVHSKQIPIDTLFTRLVRNDRKLTDIGIWYTDELEKDLRLSLTFEDVYCDILIEDLVKLLKEECPYMLDDELKKLEYKKTQAYIAELEKSELEYSQYDCNKRLNW